MKIFITVVLMLLSSLSVMATPTTLDENGKAPIQLVPRQFQCCCSPGLRLCSPGCGIYNCA
ncbi:unnamed protein product [Cercospora beticola]|nr:unnamed protein product [Cercospora beticola]